MTRSPSHLVNVDGTVFRFTRANYRRYLLAIVAGDGSEIEASINAATTVGVCESNPDGSDDARRALESHGFRTN